MVSHIYFYLHPRPTLLFLGAIFDKDDPQTVQAFKVALKLIDTPIEPLIEIVPAHNPHAALKAVCKLLNKGVIGILGPSTEENSNVVQSVLDDKDIPHLDVRWDDQPFGPIVNIYPYQTVLTQMYIDIITKWDFKDFVILYEDNNSLRRVGRLLKMYRSYKSSKIIIKQLDEVGDGNYRPVLKRVLHSGAKHYVLDCSSDILEEVLTQAQQVGLMTHEHYFIITNLDFHTINLYPFQHADANITGVSSVWKIIFLKHPPKFESPPKLYDPLI